jgi:Integral membrane protein TerC family
VVGYVALAALFGVGVWLVAGDRYSNEYFAGYITELSLSVDLFVFVVIMTSFAVPLAYQLKVLQLGIIGTLVLRGLFIAVGARRPGRPADLPLLGSRRCAGVHRRQADPARGHEYGLPVPDVSTPVSLPDDHRGHASGDGGPPQPEVYATHDVPATTHHRAPNGNTFARLAGTRNGAGREPTRP